MAQTYNSPGVYRQEIFLKAPPVLQTGVPAFVGFAGLPPGASGTFNQPIVLNRKEEFSQHFISLAQSYLVDVVGAFFDNGGIRCYVVAADSTADPVQGLRAAITALESVDDLDLVAVPDVMTLRTLSEDPAKQVPDKPSIALVQEEALAHCAREGNRMTILDSLPDASTDDVLAQRRTLTVGQQEPLNGALYYPWLLSTNSQYTCSHHPQIVRDGPGSCPICSTPLVKRLLPPCGHVAGIFARTDGSVGIFKAPANEEIFGVLDLATVIDNSVQDQLNPAGINCLRAFPGRGIRVWGARTISSDPNWRYVNVRRLFLTVGRWIDLNMGWATFEPNDQRLWVRIQRELTTYLSKLLAAGALQGAAPAEAFYVKCNAENNPPELRDAGQLVIEIGLAALSPAEFIVVRIVRQAGGTPDQ